MNLYLIGMMGSGKSVTGKKLAEMTSYEFIDLDAEIEKQEKKPITEIFAKDGEPYFRGVETAILGKFSSRDRHVFSTGGGIVLRDENVRLMKTTGKVILLDASLDVLWERVCQKKDRPLLNTPDPKGSLKKILGDRSERYRRAADRSVLTDGLTAEAVAKQIVNLLRKELS